MSTGKLESSLLWMEPVETSMSEVVGICESHGFLLGSTADDPDDLLID